MLYRKNTKLFYIITIIGLIFFSSCFGSRQPRKTPETNTPTRPTPNRGPRVEAPKTTKPSATVNSPKAENKPLPTIIQEYDIALLLPFNTSLNNLSYENDSIEDKSVMALEFYEGALIALEELKDKGFNANIYVYDTEKSRDKTKNILNQTHFKEMDLVIGPVYNKPLEEANSFSQKNKISIVSPLSPTTKFVEENPYYLNVNQSIMTHCSYIYDHIAKNGNKNIVVIHRGTKSDQKNADIFKGFAGGGKSGVEHIGMMVEELIFMDPSQEILETYLQQGRENIIVIPSFNEPFANDLVRRLNSFSGRYNITLYGMPSWNKFESLNIEHLENLNFHITSNFYKDMSKSKAIQFEQIYRANLNNLPSEYACKGYDVVKYFGKMLERKNEDDELSTTLRYSNETFGGFYFVPVINPDTGEIDYYENQKLYMLKFQNYQFRKAD